MVGACSFSGLPVFLEWLRTRVAGEQYDYSNDSSIFRTPGRPGAGFSYMTVPKFPTLTALLLSSTLSIPAATTIFPVDELPTAMVRLGPTAFAGDRLAECKP